MLPEGTLLEAYRDTGAYTDCYAVDVAGGVSHAQFVSAFYATPPFRLERWILTWAIGKPSTDADVHELAAGARENFSAWRVEGRGENQLLLCDYRGSTRSWLMVAPLDTAGGPATRLYFGSAVVPRRRSRSGKTRMGWVFRALLGFHRVYSKVLLSAARSRLAAQGV